MNQTIRQPLGNCTQRVDPFMIDEPIRIGIIGGGQLAKMIAQEAKRMSFNVIILDPTPNCPASTLADKHILADFKDEDGIKQLASESDVVTYEIELGNSNILNQLESEGYTVHPSAETLGLIQDKLVQKQTLKKHGIPVPKFKELTSTEDLILALEDYCYPAVLKARFDSYDGRGNFVIESKEHVKDALKFFARQRCFIEAFVPFVKEVSVMVAKNAMNQVISYPVVENIHRNNILDMTIAPARVSNKVKDEAKQIAESVVRTFKGSGIFGVEMFMTRDESILVNEIAPRPHNSGHYTIEACSISQFEQHIRAILNLPLAKPILLTPAVMVNIIGNDGDDHAYSIEGIRDILAIPGVKLHIYGKKAARKGRKLGHITVVDSDVEQAIDKARYVRSLIRVSETRADRNG